MAGIKISDLPAVVTPALTDIFPIDQGAVTYKETLQQVITLFQGNIVITNANFSGVLALNHGGTNAALVASNGGIFYSTATAGAILSGTATAGKVLQSGASAAPTWSTPTYPSASGTSGKLLTSDGTNIVYSTATFPVVGGAAGNIFISDGTNYVASTSLWPNTVGTSGKVVISNGTANVYSTPTFPNASATTRKIIVSDGTNWVASTETYAVPGASGNVLTSDGTNWLSSVPAATALLTTKGDIFSFSTVDARFPVAVGDGKVLQVSSGATTGLEYSTPTYPSASGSSGKILRSDGTNNIYSTSTFADTYVASNFLYANGANTIVGLATANNGLPVTGNTGIPVILAGPAATGRVLTSNAAAAPSWSTSTFPSVGGAAGNVLISDGTNYIASTSLWPNTVGTSGKILISDGTSNVYSTPTFPNAATSTGSFLYADGTNWVASTSLWPNTVGTSGKFVISGGVTNGYSTSTIPSSAGATANKLLLSDGTNYVLSTPTFPNASATSRKIIVSDGTNWVASTETYAVPGTSGNVLTSDGTNWLSSVPASTALLTTKGDLFSFSTVDARLPVAVGDGKILQVSSGAATGLAYSTPTYPSASGTALKILISDGTNNVYSTPTYPNAAVTAGKFIISDGTNYIASTSIMPNTVGTAGKLIRSDGTVNAYTTSTYPDTNAINTIMYASSANVLGSISAANSSVMVSSSGGVPSMSTTLPSGLTIPGYAGSGANSDITSMTGLTGYLQAPLGIKSSAGLINMAYSYVASAVNYIISSNNSTGGNPALSVTGSDAAVALDLKSKNSYIGILDSTGTTGGQINFYASAAVQFTSLKVAAAQATTLNLTLPAVDGAANYPLVTSGAGVLSFKQIPSFSAWNSASTTLAANGYTQVLFATEEFDVGGYFAASRYTPPAGNYIVTWGVQPNGTNIAATNLYLAVLYKNGAALKNGSFATAFATIGVLSTGSSVVSMNGTDYLEIFFYNGNAATTITTSNSINGTYFSAAYIGPVS